MKNKFFLITALCTMLTSYSCASNENQAMTYKIGVAAIVVNRNHEILIGKRDNQWIFPIGIMQTGDEGVSYTAQRFMLEHANIELIPSNHMFDLGKSEHTCNDAQSNIQAGTMMRFGVIFKNVLDEPQPSDKYTEWKWQSFKKLGLDKPRIQKIRCAVLGVPNDMSKIPAQLRKRKACEIDSVTV